jgi:hypothetical protein
VDDPTRRAAVRRSLGTALVVLLAAVAAAGATPAGAVEGGGEPEAQPVQILRQGYYTNSSGEAAPPTLTSEFPPGVVCIVRPEACNEQAKQVTGPVNDALQDNPPAEVVQDDEAPAQPTVVEGTLPTGIFAGTPHYVSALKFQLPPVPDGKELLKAELILDQEGVNYRFDSPSFREAVEAFLICATAESDERQEKCEREFRQALQPEGGQFRAGEQSPYGVDVCQILDGWKGQPNQDWKAQPESDCIVNASAGVEDAEAGTWTFDITFIAQSWLDGSEANRGLLITPQSAENVAFGDPDTSNNAQISYAGGSFADKDAKPRIRYELVEAAGTGGTFGFNPAPPAGGDVPTVGGHGDGGGGGDGGELGTVPPEPATSGSLATDTLGSAPAEQGDDGLSSGPAPQVAEPALEQTAEAAPAPAPAVAAPQTAPTMVSGAERPAPYTPWWVWLLVPAALAGMYLLSRSLTADPRLADQREGAMTRLIRKRQAERATLSPGAPA